MRNKCWMLLLGLLFLGGVSAIAQDSLKYRISLTDKALTPYSLEDPLKFLSQKALDRRAKQGLPVDSTDLPVCEQYISQLREYGVNIVARGKWDNFVTVSCSDPLLIDRIARLPFVKSTLKVWQHPSKEPEVKRDSVTNNYEQSDHFYGPAFRQIEINNGQLLHEAGFRGEGMTIAVIDAGFHNVDRIDLFRNVNILGTRDFVNPQSDIYAEDSHGMAVLSCMAANTPNVLVGTAPAAGYWLLRSEDAFTEHLVEQDYWAAAIEFADSVGVDLVNTSLGYYKFDDAEKNYSYCKLDGKFALMSRQAAKAADKGIVVVCSAGNTGSGPWKKITPPADAENILTVGAIKKDGELANFSAVGNTADNRIKPDMVALGYQSSVISTAGELRTANGTSFASPTLCGMVACLWQAYPKLTAKELMEWVKQLGDRSGCPDNVYGYGAPDFGKVNLILPTE